MNRAAHLYRLFEYVHVPSRFVGNETILNPEKFGYLDGNSRPFDVNLVPPFNKISKYREPGRINLNTVVDNNVFDALFQRGGAGIPHPGPDAVNARDNRRGYPGTYMFALNKDFPTFFANPFRAPDAGDLVPLSNLKRTGVDCTLLRTASGNEGGPSGDTFIRQDPASDHAYNDVDRNPYFRYQPAQRLANLTTTRSNVYAVWITVGYFEVEDVREDDATSNQIIQRYGTDLKARQNSSLFNKLYPGRCHVGR